MPVLPRRADDTPEPVVYRSLTPDSRAKKAEKDNQKRLRGKG
jgi:hypothetical protein